MKPSSTTPWGLRRSNIRGRVRHRAPMKAAGATSAQLRTPPPNMRAGSRSRSQAKLSCTMAVPKQASTTRVTAVSTVRAAGNASEG
eukprot:11913907-Karenia_brevis.AAC.1